MSEDGRRRVFPGNRASGTHLSEALLRNLVVCLWHLANMLNALTNVRLWVQKHGPTTAYQSRFMSTRPSRASHVILWTVALCAAAFGQRHKGKTNFALPPISVSVSSSRVYVPPPIAPAYLPGPPVFLYVYSLRCEPSSQLSFVQLKAGAHGTFFSGHVLAELLHVVLALAFGQRCRRNEAINVIRY
jgi:hypothetical protein